MISHKIEDNIVIITLENGNTNSITLEVLMEIDSIVKKVNEDDALKGIIMTGKGRFFSSGFDLPMFLKLKDHDAVVEFFKKEEQIMLNYFTCQKPVVVAINGHAAAAGLIFSMASDYRIVKNHPKIKIGMSEIKIGLPLSVAQNEVMRFGLDTDKKFRDIMYFGEMYSVDKAKELGIIDEIVEEDNLIKRAKEVVSLWIDTPNRPFIVMKYMLKKDAAEKIKRDLQDDIWKEQLKCFFKKEVRDTLTFVQASMDAIKK